MFDSAECARRCSKKYYWKHRKAIKKRHDKWRRNNRHHINEYQKRYRLVKGIVKGRRNKSRKSRYISRGRIYIDGWFELRKLIYRRDNWRCCICGVHCTQRGRSKIQCHHIDYNIKNNDHDNLVTLCASCHAKTNSNRDFWIYILKNEGRRGKRKAR